MFKISWQHLSAGLEICMKVSVSITFVNMIGFQYLYLVALNMLLNFRKLPRLFNQLIYYTPNLRIYRYLTVAEADTSFPVWVVCCSVRLHHGTQSPQLGNLTSGTTESLGKALYYSAVALRPQTAVCHHPLASTALKLCHYYGYCWRHWSSFGRAVVDQPAGHQFSGTWLFCSNRETDSWLFLWNGNKRKWLGPSIRQDLVDISHHQRLLNK